MFMGGGRAAQEGAGMAATASYPPSCTSLVAAFSPRLKALHGLHESAPAFEVTQTQVDPMGLTDLTEERESMFLYPKETTGCLLDPHRIEWCWQAR